MRTQEMQEMQGMHRMQRTPKLPELNRLQRPLGALLFGALALISGCSVVTTSDISSSVNLPEAYSEGQSAAADSGTDNSGANTDIRSWWTRWEDPELNRLVASALEANPDLNIARSRIREADAMAAMADADLNPAAEFALGGNAGKMSATSPSPMFGKKIRGNPRSITGSLSASWEIDLFGKKKSESDMYAYRALSARDMANAARIAVAASVARTYFETVAAGEELELLRESIASLSEMKRYVKGRFDAGQATSYDLEHITNEITKKEAFLQLLEAKRKNYVRALAVLTGKTPQDFTDTFPRELKTADRAPAPPQGVYPADLLQNRPDLLAKSNEIKALAAQVASATADLYPRLSLSFIWDSGTIHISNDFANVKTWAGLAGLDFSVPIFTGGRIRANIDLADAKLKTALIEYDKKLLESLAEVDNSYSLARGYSDRETALLTALKEARHLCVTTKKMFELDASDYDRVIDARLNEISLKNELLAAKLDYHRSLTDLYRSLGGGWDPGAAAAEESGQSQKEPEDGR